MLYPNNQISPEFSGCIPSKPSVNKPEKSKPQPARQNVSGTNISTQQHTDKDHFQNRAPKLNRSSSNPPDVSSRVSPSPSERASESTQKPIDISILESKNLIRSFSNENLDIHVSPRVDDVLINGNFKTVDFTDLKNHDLLPRQAFQLKALSQPILLSNFLDLGNGRKGCILYLPGESGKYIPRPIYQSNSHGAWQAPSHIYRILDRYKQTCAIKRYGKGPGRGKMETALHPELQKILSELSKESQTLAYDKNKEMVWVGTARHADHFDGNLLSQGDDNQVKILDLSYPGSKIEDKVAGSLHANRLAPEAFFLPPTAMPRFDQCQMAYEFKNSLYGDIQAEIYPSQDGNILWTFYIQKDTKRAWIAYAHSADSPITSTGLMQEVIDIGPDLPSAPYEHNYPHQLRLQLDPESDFAASTQKYVDIWKQYTSRIPMIQDYYRAKSIACPQ